MCGWPANQCYALPVYFSIHKRQQTKYISFDKIENNKTRTPNNHRVQIHYTLDRSVYECECDERGHRESRCCHRNPPRIVLAHSCTTAAAAGCCCFMLLFATAVSAVTATTTTAAAEHIEWIWNAKQLDFSTIWYVRGASLAIKHQHTNSPLSREVRTRQRLFTLICRVVSIQYFCFYFAIKRAWVTIFGNTHIVYHPIKFLNWLLSFSAAPWFFIFSPWITLFSLFSLPHSLSLYLSSSSVIWSLLPVLLRRYIILLHSVCS